MSRAAADASVSSTYPLPGFEYRVVSGAAAKWSASVPADLESLAAELGLQVRRTRLPAGVDGRTCVHERGTVVDLDAFAPTTRARFSLGHEIGHVLLTQPDVSALVRRLGGLRPHEVERMCDRIAAELLLPAVRVKPVARQSVTWRLADMLRMAGAYVVSPTALANRLSQLGGRRALFTAERFRSGGWRVSAIAGAPELRRVTLGLEGDPGCREGTLQVRISDGHDARFVEAEYRRSRDRVVVLMPVSWVAGRAERGGRKRRDRAPAVGGSAVSASAVRAAPAWVVPDSWYVPPVRVVPGSVEKELAAKRKVDRYRRTHPRGATSETRYA